MTGNSAETELLVAEVRTYMLEPQPESKGGTPPTFGTPKKSEKFTTPTSNGGDLKVSRPPPVSSPTRSKRKGEFLVFPSMIAPGPYTTVTVEELSKAEPEQAVLQIIPDYYKDIFFPQRKFLTVLV